MGDRRGLASIFPLIDKILDGCDAAPYIEYIRQQTGLIELSRISDNKRNDVPIDKLWIPSEVKLATPAASAKQQANPTLESAQMVVPIDQAVNENRLLLIRGEAGSGKSVLLKRIAWELVREARKTQDEQLKLAFNGLRLNRRYTARCAWRQ